VSATNNASAAGVDVPRSQARAGGDARHRRDAEGLAGLLRREGLVMSALTVMSALGIWLGLVLGHDAEALQVHERRVAGTEVVEVELDAQRAGVAKQGGLVGAVVVLSTLFVQAAVTSSLHPTTRHLGAARRVAVTPAPRWT